MINGTFITEKRVESLVTFHPFFVGKPHSEKLRVVEKSTIMEFTSETIISFVTLLLGGGGIGAILTWRYQRKKAKAEAEQAEAEAKQKEAEAEKAKFEAIQSAATATKEIQDSYQQLLADMKTDREEQKTYINELKEDRRHLRDERDELRGRQDKLEEVVRGLQRDVARNGRMVEMMRPFLCGREKCPHRVAVVVSADGVAEPTETAKTAKTKKKTTKKTETDGNKNQ